MSVLTSGSLESVGAGAARWSLALLVALLAGMLGVVGLLAFWSYPGRPRPFVDATGAPLPNSIAEKVFIDVNGTRQGLIIESKDTRRPVLLYLHGGMPDYFLSRKFPTGFEDLFTVAWWEQRGSGISYSPDIPKDSLTVEQLIADTLQVADYLRNRFGQDQIYLMGHSGGTLFGIQAAARAPERFRAYIGVAQMVDQLESERLAYEYMLARYHELGDVDMVRKLEASPVSLTGGTPPGYLAVRDEAMHRLGIGTMHGMTGYMRGLFLGSLQCREYTLGEKIGLWRGKFTAGVSALWSEANSTDLARTLAAVGVPVYLLHGTYDYTVSYRLARAYFEQLRAPAKGFYTFEQSAHSPIFEEPDKVQRILREDVLAGTTLLADRDHGIATTH
jgi:pimeloyl-ACP methyl ester carboxylesterase